MAKLHTFGCSITQGHALPDVVQPVLDETGRPYTPEELQSKDIKIDWEDIHLYKPSKYAWPQVLGDRLGMSVVNHARRGACFHQIARQVNVGIKDIRPSDTVIVMWTYMSRLSLQWPARTSVPLCNISDPYQGWRTSILGLNKFFGLSGAAKHEHSDSDQFIQEYIEKAMRVHIDPMGVYDRYYNNLVLQQMTAHALAGTGAQVIHLSVETTPALATLSEAEQELDVSLKESYTIPHPNEFYTLEVDYGCTFVLLDPDIPLAENDMHPSVTHHSNFADYVYTRYFCDK